jgi:hypothetical protein
VYLLISIDPAAQQCLTDLHGYVADGPCLRIEATPGDAQLCPQRRLATPPPAPPGGPRCTRG